jgi:hypothetical protein
MYKIPNSTDVIVHFLGKRQAFTNEPRNSLSEGALLHEYPENLTE